MAILRRVARQDGPRRPVVGPIRDNGGMPTAMDLRLLLRHPVEFVAGETPEESRLVFHTPDGDETATANVAIGPLSQGIRTMSPHRSVRAWATPAILALRIMARGGLAAPNPNE